MAIPAPANAVGVGVNSAPRKPSEEEIAAEEKSILQSIKDGASAVVGAVTGYGVPIEYPELLEITDIQDGSLGLVDRIIASQVHVIRDDRGKAERLGEIFKDDARFGGIYEDKFGLPMMMWNDIPYYINKPGFSEQDLNTTVYEVAKYIPAGRFVSGAKGVISTALRGLGGYTATETASQALEAALTPETTARKQRSIQDVGEEIGLATGLSVAADVAGPPLVKGFTRGVIDPVKAGVRQAGQLGRAGVEALETATQGLFPRMTPEVLQKSKYPLTVGQRTSPAPTGPSPRMTEQLSREDELRMAAQGRGTDQIRGFDQRQLDEVTSDAMEMIDEYGSGIPGLQDDLGLTPVRAAEEAQSTVAQRAGQLKEESGALYEAVKAADEPPVMTADGVRQTVDQMLDVYPQIVGPSQLVNTPILKAEIDRLRKLRRILQNPRFKDQSLERLHDYQKSLSQIKNQAAPGSPEQLALIKMKETLDQAIFEGIESGIMRGSPEVLEQLQNATGLYRQYMGLVGKGGGRNQAERTANRLLEQLSSRDYTPVQVANFLFGHNRFNPNQAVPLMLDKLQEALPAEEYARVTQLIKDGILARAFTNRQGSVSRKAVVDNFNDVFEKQKSIISKLFSEDELARIRQFRDDVVPTVWAETRGNPSGTSYALISAANRRGLLSRIPVYGSRLAEGVAETRQFAEGIEATRQTLRSLRTPVFSETSAGILRQNLVPEESEEGQFKELSPADRARMEARLNEIGQSESAMALPEFDPLPIMPSPLGILPQTLSGIAPSLLPNEDDREIAMRQMGIAGLV
jgi:hypothetical protein